MRLRCHVRIQQIHRSLGLLPQNRQLRKVMQLDQAKEINRDIRARIPFRQPFRQEAFEPLHQLPLRLQPALRACLTAIREHLVREQLARQQLTGVE
ncbi:hypothetical protein D1872_221280 [compost metagenome]